MPLLPRPSRRAWLVALLVVLVLAVGVGGTLAWGGRGPTPVATRNLTINVKDGPNRDQPVRLDATLYLPAHTPAPAVLVAHGFGGSKDDVAADASDLARRGFVALTWSARGFGASTGQIGLDSPDYEVTDASQLVDWLATRPEVQLDGPGDPRVGVTGDSYGGALALLLAGYDRRIDAIAPVITWNDLGQALFPQSATRTALPLDSPARAADGQDGVFKRDWAADLFASALRPPRDGAAAPAPVTACGRFLPQVCHAYTEAAATGRTSPALLDLLRRSSPATVTNRITAPTLLVQGEQDTLFGLEAADANARQIAATGTPVKVLWYAGGHDGAAPGDEVRAAVGAWFDHWLAGRGPDPGTGFSYAVRSGVRANGTTPTSRVVRTPGYPGIAGHPPVTTRRLPLHGPAQSVITPPGGVPAAVSSVPGLPGAASTALGRFTGDLPGQAAVFSTDPVPGQVLVAGVPRVALAVSAVPGQPGAADAVFFGKLYDLGPDGRRTLLGGSVAPFQITGLPADGTPVDLTVTLPGVVRAVQSGHRLQVVIATTDQAYANPVAPAVHRVALAAGFGLGVPLVPGVSTSAAAVPVAPLVGIGVILVLAALVALALRLRQRRRRRRRPDTDAALAGVPLVLDTLSKSYPGGVRAVDGVSFRLDRGQVLGLLGPNGAGKSTVLRMVMGLITPSDGQVRLFGHLVRPGAPVLSRTGCFVEGPGFLPHLSGAENLRLYWAATGRPATDAHLAEALKIAGLGDAVHRKVKTYSQGMRQRLAIAQAMLGLPDLLLLDEPTNGLDPPQIHQMREVLCGYASGGRAVLVSSHLLAEVEQTCTHVVVMHRGRVLAAGEVAALVAGRGAASFVVDAPVRAAGVLRGLAGITGVEVDETAVHADLDGLPRAAAVAALVRAGLSVSSAGPRRRLEDAFLALVNEEPEP